MINLMKDSELNLLKIMFSGKEIGFYSLFREYSQDYSKMLKTSTSSFNFVMIYEHYRGRGYFINSLASLINSLKTKALVVEYPEDYDKWERIAFKLLSHNLIKDYKFFDYHLVLYKQ